MFGNRDIFFSSILSVMLMMCSTAFSQNPQWLNYTYGGQVNVLFDAGVCIWAGTTGGLVRIDKASGAILFYNKANSGLPGNQVCAIAMDGDGILWIGTNQGLAQFDGLIWKTFTTFNSGLPYSCVHSIAIDGKGNKWIYVEGDLFWGQAGFVKFDGTNWETVKFSKQGISGANMITSMIEDSKSNMWFGTSSSGLARFDGISWTVYDMSNSGLPGNNIRTIVIDENDTKWIGTSKGLAQFDGINWTSYDSLNSGLPGNHVNSIAIDGNGSKWIVTNRGIARFDGANWTTFTAANSGLPDDRIDSITIDINQTKWIRTYYSGLIRFDGINWTTFNASNSDLHSDYISSIVIDGNGDKWIGTGDNGMVKFDDRSWTTFNTSNSGLPTNFVQTIALDKNDDMWFGTMFGLAQFDGKHWIKHDFLEYIVSIAVEDDGTLWAVADRFILAEYDGTTWTDYDISESGLTFDWVTALAVDRNGDKWIGTDGGAVKFDGTNWQTLQQAVEIRAITIDAEGNKWIGTADRGLIKFDGSKWKTFHDFDSGLLGNGVNSIAIDVNGDKWIGTDAGLARFDDTQWTTYDTLNSELPSDNIGPMAVEANGVKWITAGGGLVRFDGEHWTTYSAVNSGLPYAGITAIAIDKQGNKWIALDDAGVAVFNQDGIVSGITNPDLSQNAGIHNFTLCQNYPNPFNPATEITYQIPLTQHVSLAVYDLLGRLVKTLVDGENSAGSHSVRWDGRDVQGNRVSSGVYLYRIQTEEFCETGKAILCK